MREFCVLRCERADADLFAQTPYTMSYQDDVTDYRDPRTVFYGRALLFTQTVEYPLPATGPALNLLKNQID